MIFASNRTTYVRYMSVQILQMNMLSEDMDEAFNKELFVGKLAKGVLIMFGLTMFWKIQKI